MHTYNIIPLEQRSQAWFDFRKGKIGSSDVCSIMGANPWETRFECWERIILNKQRPVNEAMQRGTDLEDKARETLNRQTGRNYQPVVLQSIEHPDIIASLDGYWVSPEGKVYIAEIKCPGKKAHALALQGQIPDYNYPQVVHQQDLAQADHTVYFSWDGISNVGAIVEYQVDEEYAYNMHAEILRFLACLVDFKAPEAGDKDWLKLSDSRLFEKAKLSYDLSEQIKKLKDEQDALRDELIEECAHSRALIVGADGSCFKLQKITRKGTLDYDRLFKDYHIQETEKYRKAPVESWRLSV